MSHPEDYLPSEDPTPVQGVPMLRNDPPTDAIRCVHCGRLTPRPPIARPLPENAPPALEPKTCGPIPKTPVPGDKRIAETQKITLGLDRSNPQ